MTPENITKWQKQVTPTVMVLHAGELRIFWKPVAEQFANRSIRGIVSDKT
jgi:hypothetical protein